MDQEGFDLQVLIPDNRPMGYEVDPDLGRALARAYNDAVAEDLAGHHRFIGVNTHQEVVTVFSGLSKEIHVTIVEQIGHHVDVDSCDFEFSRLGSMRY